MKTAEEEILLENCKGDRNPLVVSWNAATKSMSDFAMQNAIEFDTWKYQNCWVMWEDGLYHNLPKGLANFEPVRVYNLFKQRNNG